MRVTRLAALALVAGLTGCGSELDDLREFTRSAHADRAPKIEPVPEVKPQESFTYAAADRPDPFSPANLRPAVARGEAKAVRPETNRRKEPLEEYPIDALKMVGTLTRGRQFWAVIQAPDGTVHRVQVGNHLGQHSGKVTKISEARVEVLEYIQGAVGEWVEREAVIAISE
jgi:type IV pilus assembly protein PilP